MNPHPVLIDALAEARLEALHLTGSEAGRPEPWDVDAATAATADASTLAAGLSLRMRLGHGLVALGAAIAGEDESTHVHHAA